MPPLSLSRQHGPHRCLLSLSLPPAGSRLPWQHTLDLPAGQVAQALSLLPLPCQVLLPLVLAPPPPLQVLTLPARVLQPRASSPQPLLEVPPPLPPPPPARPRPAAARAAERACHTCRTAACECLGACGVGKSEGRALQVLPRPFYREIVSRAAESAATAAALPMDHTITFR